MKGIAFPGTFIIDRKGRVTSPRFFEDFYVERNTVSSLLVRVGVHGASVAATKVSGPHLDLTTYPSDPEIAPGNRFSVVLDIKPAPGIHVYACGAKVIVRSRISMPISESLVGRATACTTQRAGITTGWAFGVAADAVASGPSGIAAADVISTPGKWRPLSFSQACCARAG
jgi:hypothetical protein